MIPLTLSTAQIDMGHVSRLDAAPGQITNPSTFIPTCAK